MPRATKKDPFFIYAPRRSGFWKGKRLIGVNHSYEGKSDALTLKQFLEFLEANNVDPADVVLGNGFSAYAVVR